MREFKRLVPERVKHQVKKYREKTTKEHAADGLVMLLKKIGNDDNKMYYIEKKDNKYVNDLSVEGTDAFLKVKGTASIGYFDINKKGKNFKSRKIEYEYEGHIGKDQLGQKVIVVSSFNISGIDDLQVE